MVYDKHRKVWKPITEYQLRNFTHAIRFERRMAIKFYDERSSECGTVWIWVYDEDGSFDTFCAHFKNAEDAVMARLLCT
jgi:hypothetical protein